MNRQRHAQESQIRLSEAVDKAGTGDLTSAGESIWATIVHSVSAADPEHENTAPDLFKNPHHAPNTKKEFEEAVARINTPIVLIHNCDDILRIAQGHLHNNYYHLHLQQAQLSRYVARGLFYATIINGIAQQCAWTQHSTGS